MWISFTSLLRKLARMGNVCPPLMANRYCTRCSFKMRPTSAPPSIVAMCWLLRCVDSPYRDCSQSISGGMGDLAEPQRFLTQVGEKRKDGGWGVGCQVPGVRCQVSGVGSRV